MQQYVVSQGPVMQMISGLATAPREFVKWCKFSSDSLTIDEFIKQLQLLEDEPFVRITKKGWKTFFSPQIGLIQWQFVLDGQTQEETFVLLVKGGTIIRYSKRLNARRQGIWYTNKNVSHYWVRDVERVLFS